MRGNMTLIIHAFLEERLTKTFKPLAEIPSAPYQWAAIACSPSWMARIPLRQTNSKSHSPIMNRETKSCAEGGGGEKGKFHGHPNQSQTRETESTTIQTKHKTRQVKRLLRLFAFLVLFIVFTLIGEKILYDLPGWRTVGLAAIMGWLIALSVNLEETHPRNALQTTLSIELAMTVFGIATLFKEKGTIDTPWLLCFLIAIGSIATATINYLNVTSVTEEK